MTRVGTYGHDSMPELIENIIKCGLGASELFSCGLKAAGTYMSRHAPPLQAEAQAFVCLHLCLMWALQLCDTVVAMDQVYTVYFL